jgi:hypothetical protein
MFGGLMVSVLAIRPKAHGFKPDRGNCDGFLRAMTILTTPFFGREVKPEAPCRKILPRVKIISKYERKYFARPNSSFRSPVLPACYQMTAGRIAREL